MSVLYTVLNKLISIVAAVLMPVVRLIPRIDLPQVHIDVTPIALLFPDLGDFMQTWAMLLIATLGFRFLLRVVRGSG